jgi:O-antigen/teichoic acid export membrane protein
MHAPIEQLAEATAPQTAPQLEPQTASAGRLISLTYLMLRGASAAGAVTMGFVQTFVFARVLDPRLFSIFILTAAVGYSLWIADLGLAKIAFVNLRAPHLDGRRDPRAAGDAGAVILFYILLSCAATLACFGVVLLRTGASTHEALDLALFLSFIALNLAWSSLRTISLAVDLFVFFESLEFLRRAINIATLLAVLAGLPLTVFLVSANVLWAAMFIAAMNRLARRGALTLHVLRFPRELRAFFAANWAAIWKSSAGALSELFVVTFPYYLVPAVFGLGAAPIILDTAFKIFRGVCTIFAAVCDLAVPGQTRAYAAGDGRRLAATTLLAAGLCAIPALAAGGLLILGGNEIYRFLLHTAATVPPEVTPVIVVLLLAGVLQIVAEALLQHTGYFKSLAWNGGLVVAMMLVATVVTFVGKLSLIGFLTAYAVAYALGALCLTAAAIIGPIRTAALTTPRSAPQSPRSTPSR